MMPRSVARLGCLADDYTGGTDLSNALTEAGLRVVQLFGPPDAATPHPDELDAEAVVIALKTRTAPAADAVAAARAAVAWLRQGQLHAVFFKYCSTFDSTPAGNIGQVHDALMSEFGEQQSITTPATPENGRTVFLGHLFVGDQLLSGSSMRHHPLTPMTDSSIPRLLSAQSRAEIRLVPLSVVRAGASAVRAHMSHLLDAAPTPQILVCDGSDDADLDALAEATSHLRVIAGAAGLGRAVGRAIAARSGTADRPAQPLPAACGPAAVLAGSCSAATLSQVERMAAVYPTFHLDAEALSATPDLAERAVRWAARHLPDSPVLISASQPPEQVARVQHHLGAARAAELVETAMALIAAGLCELGVRRLVVAGGETSGAVMNRLGIKQVRVGPALAPGVPWVYTDGHPRLQLALKSGNFGGPDLFLDAVADSARQDAAAAGPNLGG
jgi:3-dehydrotetronate 4-kinase